MFIRKKCIYTLCVYPLRPDKWQGDWDQCSTDLCKLLCAYVVCHMLPLDSWNIWCELSQQLNSHRTWAAAAPPSRLHIPSFLTPTRQLNREIIQQQSCNEIWSHPWCHSACSSDQLERSAKGKDENLSFSEDVPTISSFYPTEGLQAEVCVWSLSRTSALRANENQIPRRIVMLPEESLLEPTAYCRETWKWCWSFNIRDLLISRSSQRLYFRTVERQEMHIVYIIHASLRAAKYQTEKGSFHWPLVVKSFKYVVCSVLCNTCGHT